MKIEEIRKRIFKSGCKEARVNSARRRRLESYRTSVTGRKCRVSATQRIAVLQNNRVAHKRISESAYRDHIWLGAVMAGIRMDAAESELKNAFLQTYEQSIYPSSITEWMDGPIPYNSLFGVPSL